MALPKQYSQFRRLTPADWKQASFDIKRYKAIDTMISKLVPGLSGELSKIAYDVASQVMVESKLEYVPVLTGRLRASGRAEIPQINNADGTVSVDLSYNTPYAWVQHETNPRKPKYLERPFWDVVNSGVMEERIARKILQMMELS